MNLTFMLRMSADWLAITVEMLLDWLAFIVMSSFDWLTAAEFQMLHMVVCEVICA